MFFKHSIWNLPAAWRRKLAVGSVLFAAGALLVWSIQPALARPLAQGADPATDTTTPTATPTITPTHAATMALVINEIAWAGTLGDADAEWIELYNASGDTIDLTGWKLRAVDDLSSIYLTGSIPPGGYFLLAREGHSPFANVTATPTRTLVATSTSSVTPTDVFNPVLVVNQTFSGPLSNDGESLVLIDPSGSIIDRANSTLVNSKIGPWPAGNATSRCSMERRASNFLDAPNAWITASQVGSNGYDARLYRICGSPGKQNWAYTVTITPSPTQTRTRTPIPGKTATPNKGPTRTPTRIPNRTLPSSIVINEFLTQPRFDWNGDGKVDSGDEYIELINLSTQPVSISGWRLDDQDGGSNPYTISNITMQPKVRMVFFASQTGILLSNGGDSVRLFKSNGQISDAFTYGVVQVSDITWCRLPDGGSSWVFGCAPTVAEANRLGGSSQSGSHGDSAVCLLKNIPLGVLLAECDPLGLSLWDASLWDALSLKFPRFFQLDNNLYILE